MIIKNRLFAIAGFVLYLLAAQVCFAMPPNVIMPSELHSGMRGIAKTVVSGTKIENFNVEVVDVMRQSGPAGGDLVLVRLSGDVIRRTGGIAQGMSGSPVFFNGRLAGALAFGWSLTEADLCMMTPISEMLKISGEMRHDIAEKNRLAEEERIKKAKEEAKDLIKTIEDKKNNKDTQKQEQKPKTDEANGQDNVLTALKELLPQGTPFMASGFSEGGLAILKSELKDLDIVPYNVGGIPYDMGGVKLEPGSSVSVDLIRGDFKFGAIGTVTWVDDKEVLAFGHTFTKKGKTNYFLSNAYIFTTVRSLNNSFKVGAAGELLGTVMQDRSSGIAGQIGFYPDIIPMLIKVNDKTRSLKNTAAVQIIHDEMFSPALAQASVVSIVDNTADRSGEGTGTVKFIIRAKNLPDGREIKRENMFYSSANINAVLASEMVRGLHLLTRNRYKHVDITDVDIDIELTDERRVASIISAKSLTKSAKAGEEIAVEVTLQPYREQQIRRIAKFTVPKDQMPGPMSLSVRGGISLVSLQSAVQQQNAAETALLLRADSAKEKTFEEQIDEFNNRDRNNDIIVDVINAVPQPKKKEKNKNQAEIAAQQEKQLAEFVQGTKYKTNTWTNYIITGETSTVINIDAPVSNDEITD